MFERFDVRPVFRGHLKGLTDGSDPSVDHPRPDWPTRLLLVGLPGAVFVAMVVLGGKLSAPMPLLTAVALLTGGLLSVFGAMASLRLKLTEWSEESDARSLDRDSLDESVAHIMAGALACIADAIVLVIALNLRCPGQEAIGGVLGALAAAITTYIALVFIITIPRLYSAYVEFNKVPDRLNGFERRARYRRP